MIIGIGALCLDHIFLQTERGLVYVDSAGGGSVWNCLANLASFGHSPIAVCENGSDVAGQLAARSLVQCGVAVRAATRDAWRTTVIFESVGRASPDSGDHAFDTSCVICDREVPAVSRHSMGLPAFDEPFSVVCVDTLGLHAERYADIALLSGALSVIDIGRRGLVCDMLPLAIRSALARFGLVFVPMAVASLLCDKLRVPDLMSLYVALGCRCLCVSAGSSGACVFYCVGNDLRTIEIPPPDVKVVDSSGAGDYLVALLIDCILTSPRLTDGLELLQHKAPGGLAKVVSSVGARGHLGLASSQSNTLTAFAGMTVEDIRHVVINLDVCPYCESTS